MLRCLPLALAFAATTQFLVAATDAASVRLIGEHDRERYVFAGVEQKVLYCTDGAGKRVRAPDEITWKIEGDLRAQADLVLWSPDYTIYRRLLADSRHAEEEQRYRALAFVVHAAEAERQRVPWTLRSYWPEGIAKEGVVVFAWLVNGAPTQVAVRPVPSTSRKYFSSSVRFDLTPEEAAGQAVALLWVDGKFVAPSPMFKDPGAQQILVAAVHDDIAAINRALEAGASPRATTAHQVPLLSHIAGTGSAKAVQALLVAGAKPNDGARGIEALPLLWAADRGRAGVVTHLLAAGAATEPVRRDGTTPLHIAINSGFADVALMLIAAKADVVDPDASGRAPITLALDHGLSDVVRTLLTRKVRINFKDPQTARVLITQAELGFTGNVQLLLENKVPVDVEYQDATALIAGARWNDAALAGTLLAAGSQVNRQTASGFTALMSASLHGSLEYARVLIEAGADCQLAQKDGMTALHHAAGSGNPEVVRLLLSRGASPQAKTTGGHTPLHLALAAHQGEIASVLVREGATLDLKSADGSAWLEHVLATDQAELVRRAMKNGWPLDTKLHGRTVLSAAEILSAYNCTKLLADAGAPRDDAGAVPIVMPRKLDARPRMTAVLPPVDPRTIDAEYRASQVEVEFLINPDGSVQFLRALGSPQPLLAAATLDAVKHWKFTPPKAGGQPAAAHFRMPIEFPSSFDRALHERDVDELPKLTHQPMPDLPVELRGRSGSIYLRFVINAQGHVEHLRIISSPHPLLNEPVMKAVQQWRYRPAKRDGQPVPMRSETTLRF